MIIPGNCYSFDLGGGPNSTMSQYPVEVRAWHNVEIRREGRRGRILLEGEQVGEVSLHFPKMHSQQILFPNIVD